MFFNLLEKLSLCENYVTNLFLLTRLVIIMSFFHNVNMNIILSLI
jgi:hypothetical protein